MAASKTERLKSQGAKATKTSQVDTFLPSEDAKAEEKPKKKKYLNVDVTENGLYLKLMSERAKVSQSKYINNLIEADKKKNKATFEKLLEAHKALESI